MIYREKKEINGWTVIDYTTTWKYDYSIMLDMAQTFIDADFQEHTQKVAIGDMKTQKEVDHIEEVRKVGFNLRSCDLFKEECGAVIVAGVSKTLSCPIQIVLLNNSNSCRIFCQKNELFADHGDHVFDNYLNSIEIRAYRRDAERKVLDTMNPEQLNAAMGSMN